jgi:segregation and condensation protein A
VIALGELQISWTGSDEGEVAASDEFDIPVTLLDDGASDEPEDETPDLSVVNETEGGENV